ncbi:hypothetical protein C8J57DRAFT_1464465 [Mycena rebaudengoi]|nr:hypothetical protein C8J57DRAFT_1464465 [Mycena rebaudengoi]
MPEIPFLADLVPLLGNYVENSREVPFRMNSAISRILLSLYGSPTLLCPLYIIRKKRGFGLVPIPGLSPGPQQQNIFQLTHTFVDGTNCTVNVLLCARVALMCKVYLTNLGPKFWDGLDEKLASICTKADGDSHKISRVFHHILKTDRQTHGENNYELDDGVDAFQQQVDDVIAAGVTDGTSTQAQDQPEQAGDT